MITLDGGRETGAFQAEKWDADQIGWTSARDYDSLRLLRPGQEPEAPHFFEYGCLPYEVYRVEDCNSLTAAGWTLAMATGSWLGTTGTKFSASVGRIGLGTGAPTNYNDTALTSVAGITGTGNWTLVSGIPVWTAPTGATPGNYVFQATFATAYGNGAAITEFAVDQGTSTAVSNLVTAVPTMVNHGTCAAGTKTVAQTWNITVTMTFT